MGFTDFPGDSTPEALGFALSAIAAFANQDGARAPGLGGLAARRSVLSRPLR